MHATPFLELFGHVEVARLLFEQAILADEKLNKKPGDSSSLSEEDALFYNGKITSARFFSEHILPQVHALGTSIQSDDTSILEMKF